MTKNFCLNIFFIDLLAYKVCKKSNSIMYKVNKTFNVMGS